MKYEYREAVAEDLEQIVSLDLRDDDLLEIKAGVGLLPSCALYKAVVTAEKSWVIEVDGRIVGVFGITPYGDGTGNPWLLGTEEMITIPKKFLRTSKRIVEEMQNMYSYLWNWVAECNEAACRWLEFLGFKIDYTLPLEIRGVTFLCFSRIKE